MKQNTLQKAKCTRNEKTCLDKEPECQVERGALRSHGKAPWGSVQSPFIVADLREGAVEKAMAEDMRVTASFLLFLMNHNWQRKTLPLFTGNIKIMERQKMFSFQKRYRQPLPQNSVILERVIVANQLKSPRSISLCSISQALREHPGTSYHCAVGTALSDQLLSKYLEI